MAWCIAGPDEGGVVKYQDTQGGHRWELENGAAVQVTDVDWSMSGRVYAKAEVFAPGGDELVSAGLLELSDVRRRSELATDIAKRNGNDEGEWGDTLLAIYTALEERHRADTLDIFAPVELAAFEEPPQLKFTVERVAPQGMTTTMYGDSGQGKSTVASWLAMCVATGAPFLGLSTIKGPVLLLDWELTRDLTLGRLYRIARGMGLDRPPPGVFYQSFHTPLKQLIGDIRSWSSTFKPELIIVDSFGPASGGDPLDHVLATDLLSTVRSIDATRILVDHQSNPVRGVDYKEKRAFGSAWKTHLTRSALQLQAVATAPGKLSAILRHQKANFGPRIDDMAFHIHYDEPGIYLEAAAISDPEFQQTGSLPTHQRVETYLHSNGPSTKKAIAINCEVGEKTVGNAISHLRQHGKVPQTADAQKNQAGELLYELISATP
jgi:hypothetical protein